MGNPVKKNVVTYTEMFIKKEIDFGKVWARMIAARRPALRAIS